MMRTWTFRRPSCLKMQFLSWFFVSNGNGRFFLDSCGCCHRVREWFHASIVSVQFLANFRICVHFSPVSQLTIHTDKANRAPLILCAYAFLGSSECGHCHVRLKKLAVFFSLSCYGRVAEGRRPRSSFSAPCLRCRTKSQRHARHLFLRLNSCSFLSSRPLPPPLSCHACSFSLSFRVSHIYPLFFLFGAFLLCTLLFLLLSVSSSIVSPPSFLFCHPKPPPLLPVARSLQPVSSLLLRENGPKARHDRCGRFGRRATQAG